MTALQRLADRLRSSSCQNDLAFPVSSEIDQVIKELEKRGRSGTTSQVPEDLQMEAMHRFWDKQEFETLKDARLVSFGMCVPMRSTGRRIMDDRQCFRAVLDSRTGVDQWASQPRWFRRCYQGLVRSYFTYDKDGQTSTPAGRENWGDLRDYLKSRVPNIQDEKVNPDWVKEAERHQGVFADKACDPYAAAVLNGDTSVIDQLCERLGIVKSSWFLRELVLAQVREATKSADTPFLQVMPRLLQILASNQVLRDKGLILVLDRYAQMGQAALHPQLRDNAVDWWGNPWLPSNASRWGGVRQTTRSMVSDWLKREFIEAFFTKLAQDGVGDRRRANFWLRYVKSMDNVQFALGSQAFSSRDKDFVILRKKMEGLFTQIDDGAADNNAFIMTIGKLVAVEFGSGGNAFYGYDKGQALPFDLSAKVRLGKNARNSLKSDRKILWMLHKDNIHGWSKWEDMFDATLRKEFQIVPNAIRAPAPVAASIVTLESAVAPKQAVVLGDGDAATASPRAGAAQPYSPSALSALARTYALSVQDLSDRNGNVWVRYHDNEPKITSILVRWGFRYKADKGWWRVPEE